MTARQRQDRITETVPVGVELVDYPGPRREALLMLGLVDPVTEPEITRAYRHLAKRLHPDAVASEQADSSRFAAVRDAYAFLLGTPRSTPSHEPHLDRTTVRTSPDSEGSGTWIAVGPPMVSPVHPGRRRR